MFTGLVEKIGRIRRVSRGKGLVLEISFEPWPEPLSRGESIAVNGVCLTVADCDRSRFTADILDETCRRSTLGGLLPGAPVNLERALRAGSPMGGHIVQGHVDCTGRILERTPRGRDFRLRIECGRVAAAQCVLKGSVAIDGVSLTITSIDDTSVSVDIIPSTAASTVLGARRPGDAVNIETDVVGKYIARNAILESGAAPAGSGGRMLTEEDFLRAGW